MKALAAAMVPDGMVLMNAGGTDPDGNVQAAKMSRIDFYLPGLLDALTRLGLNDTDMVLLALACVRTETGSFKPKDEPEYDLNTTGTYINNATGQPTWSSNAKTIHNDHNPTSLKLHHGLQTKKVGEETWQENAQSVKGDIYQGNPGLGNTQPGDGWYFRGRGFIQLTGRFQYTAASRHSGVGDLFVTNPDAVNSQQYAGAAVAGYLKASEKNLRKNLRDRGSDRTAESRKRRHIRSDRFSDRMECGQTPH